jgi:twitching motility protein PilU
VTELAQLLNQLVVASGSDLFISVGAVPQIKVEGRLEDVQDTAPIDSQAAHTLCYSIMNDEQRATFDATMELNLGLQISSVGRFRLNLFRQQGEPSLVARHVKSEVPSFESLGLPDVLQDLIMDERGLVLLVGGTGTGKSTTLASMIDYRNSNRSGHILTIEDPVEFVHSHKQSLINQREVGLDTESYGIALKNAMREAPDVIMIGEVRDEQTMRHAVTYAETGHLCLTTLHANNADHALQRILTFYPEAAHRQLLQDLSMHLKAIVSQRLVRGPDGKRVAAVEVLLNTPFIAELIREGQVDKIKDAMFKSREQGCKTFDDALFDLVVDGRTTQTEALRHADSRTNLALRFKLEGVGDDARSLPFKKDVSFARNAPFDTYETFCLDRGKVTQWPEKLKPMVDQVEEGIRHALVAKGMTEDRGSPDVVVQYALGTKQERLELEDIDNPVQAHTVIDADTSLRGLLGVSIIDTRLRKPVWRVTASREMTDSLRPQEAVNTDSVELFSEFPPL